MTVYINGEIYESAQDYIDLRQFLRNLGLTSKAISISLNDLVVSDTPQELIRISEFDCITIN